MVKAKYDKIPELSAAKIILTVLFFPLVLPIYIISVIVKSIISRVALSQVVRGESKSYENLCVKNFDGMREAQKSIRKPMLVWLKPILW